MSIEHWSFEKFVLWLSATAKSLGENGFTVDLQCNDESRTSVRLRAEKAFRVGELVVWDDGTAYEAVIDLKSGDFIHEKDGHRLNGDWESQLEPFFAHTDSRVPGSPSS